jgi:hypothetical protein
MNVTIDAMKGSPASRVLWWFTLLCVIAGGLAMRLATIDRGTPAIGAFVYFGLLAVLIVLVALPMVAVTAFTWHYADRAPRLAFVKRLGDDRHARWAVTLVVALATILFSSATGRLPKWHVWMSVTAVNALVAWRLFSLALHALRSDAATRARSSEAVSLRSFERIDTWQQTTMPRFASDDRNVREHWRNKRREIRFSKYDHRPI